MIYSHSGPIPKHRYVWLEPSAVGDHDWIQAVWFGLVSYPGRAWGCNVLLECGAIYRNVPLNKLSTVNEYKTNLGANWTPANAQAWDCYGYQFSVVEYPFLAEMAVAVKMKNVELWGTYMFSLSPIGDGWSNAPQQAKEFEFIELDNGRFTAQPTDRILFDDKSFSTMAWPKFIRRQTEKVSCE